MEACSEEDDCSFGYLSILYFPTGYIMFRDFIVVIFDYFFGDINNYQRSAHEVFDWNFVNGPLVSNEMKRGVHVSPGVNSHFDVLRSHPALIHMLGNQITAKLTFHYVMIQAQTSNSPYCVTFNFSLAINNPCHGIIPKFDPLKCLLIVRPAQVDEIRLRSDADIRWNDSQSTQKKNKSGGEDDRNGHQRQMFH